MAVKRKPAHTPAGKHPTTATRKRPAARRPLPQPAPLDAPQSLAAQTAIPSPVPGVAPLLPRSAIKPRPAAPKSKAKKAAPMAGHIEPTTPFQQAPAPAIPAGSAPGSPTPGSARRAAKRPPPAGHSTAGPSRAKPRPRPPVRKTPAAGSIPSVAPKRKASPKAAHTATRPKKRAKR